MVTNYVGYFAKVWRKKSYKLQILQKTGLQICYKFVKVTDL